MKQMLKMILNLFTFDKQRNNLVLEFIEEGSEWGSILKRTLHMWKDS